MRPPSVAERGRAARRRRRLGATPRAYLLQKSKFTTQTRANLRHERFNITHKAWLCSNLHCRKIMMKSPSEAEQGRAARRRRPKGATPRATLLLKHKITTQMRANLLHERFEITAFCSWARSCSTEAKAEGCDAARPMAAWSRVCG